MRNPPVPARSGHALAAGSASLPNSPAGQEFSPCYPQEPGRIGHNGFGLPSVLESFAQEGQVHVDVYGIFAFPSAACQRLTVPANWCDIVSPAQRQACTYRKCRRWLLTFTSPQNLSNRRKIASIHYTAGSCATGGYLTSSSCRYRTFRHERPQTQVRAVPLEGGRLLSTSLCLSRHACPAPGGKGLFCDARSKQVGFT